MAQKSGDPKKEEINPEDRYRVGEKFGRKSGKDAVVCVHKPINGSPILFVGMSKSGLREGAFLRRCSAGKGVVHTINNADGETQAIVDKLEKMKAANQGKLDRNDIEQIVRGQQLQVDRVKAVVDLLMPIKNVRSRAVLLRIAEIHAKAEKECLTIKRVVFSGESFGETFFSRTADKIPIRILFAWLTKLNAIFSIASKQVRHMFVSACSCGYRGSIQELRKMFPSLLTVTGYASKCPGGQTACDDMDYWQKRTYKDIQKTIEPRETRRVNGEIKMATCSSVEGYRRKEKDKPLRDFLGRIRKDEELFGNYLNGVDKKEPLGDPEVGISHDLFRQLMELVDRPDFQGDEQQEHYKKLLGQTKRLRYWCDIRQRFGKQYNKILISGFSVAGVAVSDFSGLTRKKLVSLIEDFQKVQAAASLRGPNRTSVEETLKKLIGLYELDSVTIPDEWLEGDEPDFDEFMARAINSLNMDIDINHLEQNQELDPENDPFE